ncbi:MAG TPA: NHL repeat-containing protein, partial [Acidobacteriota bacterium]|nr:NHL repeat-containing protein [Acidobacteriota bacterium]
MTGSSMVTVIPLPTAFTVTGGGSFCAGGSGVAVGLSGSQTGVNYQLLVGATPVGSPVPGTGAAVSFGNQTVAGTYTVTASASGCNATMTSSATVTIIPLATVNAGPDQTVCSSLSSPVTLAAVLRGSATGGTWTGGGGVFVPNNMAPNASYQPTAGEISAGSVTLTYNPVGACPGVSDSMTISFVGCNPIGLMVADTTNNRIQGFDGTDWFTIGAGGIGSGPGQFRQPEAVAYDAGGRIYVADTGNNRIQFSTDSGSTWADFATNGTGPNQVSAPQGVALDSDGNLYVSDTGNGRVLRFAGGIPGLAVVLASHGTASGQVGSPMGLVIDTTFRLFVTDASNSRVLRIANANTTTLATSGVAIATAGTALNKVIAPQGITIDGNGDLYVADTGNNRILQWKNANPTTANSSAVALTGSGLGQVNRAEGVSVTQFMTGPYAGGQVLVIGDTSNNRIQGRLIPTGSWTLIGAPDSVGTGIGQFRAPSKIQ